jgi:3-deoxy-manno-octulosonate cytidylyltransferase (CMP-KDO synthetase)
VKAVVEGEWAVDFRREPTPGAFRHVGIYAYRPDFLERFTKLAPTRRERERRLEQMRALDNGVRIRAARARHPGAGIDTAADYAAFVIRYRGKA